MSILVIIDHDRGELDEVSLQAIAAAVELGEVSAFVAGSSGATLSIPGVSMVHIGEGEVLDDYAPEAWADAIVDLIDTSGASAALASGTERMNEVMAHVAARMDLPMVANVTTIDAASDVWNLTRVRWGGSLLEDSTHLRHQPS